MKSFIFSLIIALTLTGVLLLVGCDNQGAGLPTQPEASTLKVNRVVGMLLFCGGKPAAYVDSAQVTGLVCAKLNQNSDIFEVEFFDEYGAVINENDQQHKLAWACDEQYAQFELASEWGFCICGKKIGKTTFRLRLESGRTVVYTSPAIPLEIK